MCGGVTFWGTVQPVQERKHDRYNDDDDDDESSIIIMSCHLLLEHASYILRKRTKDYIPLANYHYRFMRLTHTPFTRFTTTWAPLRIELCTTTS